MEADELDALREPRIADLCGLPQPPADYFEENEEDEDNEACADSWQGKIAILSPWKTSDGSLGGCPFLDAANCCTIYPTRPEVCVAFAPGGKQCRQARDQESQPLFEE